MGGGGGGRGGIIAVLQTASKKNNNNKKTTLNVAIHSHVYEWICFRFGMMIDTIVLFFFFCVPQLYLWGFTISG